MTINTHQLICYIRHFLKAKRKGHGIHSPFAYTLCEEVFYNKYTFYDFEILAKVRQALLHTETEITVEDFGAGSKTFKSPTRKINHIAQRGISSAKQSELLYKLLHFLKGEQVVELGSSLGLNTLYMAKACYPNKVISIEGSQVLYQFATTLAKKNKISTIHFIHGRFEEAFPEVLRTLNHIGVLYVDGNHTYAATMRYFLMALEKKNEHSVFIFDDIYWSKEMTQAWKEIKTHPAVSLSIDAFYFGLVFFKPELKEKLDLRLFI